MIRGLRDYLQYDGEKPGWGDAVSKSFKAKGRASRLEYWNFQLFYWLIPIVLTSFGTTWVWVGFNVIAGISIWVFMPAQISVFIRRAHDSGRRGYWWFIPFGHIFISLVPGDTQANEFGEPHPYVIRNQS